SYMKGLSLMDSIDLLNAFGVFLDGRCYECIQVTFCMNCSQEVCRVQHKVCGIMQNGRLTKPLCGVLKDFVFRFLQGH
ncbi:MAG: hypothetical protein ACKO7X_04500, partial [Bacteroidota bacterium]